MTTDETNQQEAANKKKIVILDGYSVTQGELSWREIDELGQLTVYERTRPEDVVRCCQDADAILTNKVIISAEIMAQLPQLKYIGVLATGYNVVDLESARQRGIIVTNIPAYSTQSVAQMVFAHILNVANRIEHYATENRHGRWTRSIDFCWMDTPVMELDGKTIGIVGLGNIGTAVARIAHAFGMKVAAYTSKPQSALPDYIHRTSIEDLFRQSDYLTLHCQLNEETRHLVNKQRIALMKPEAVIINTGRGPLVNEQDVAEALWNNKISAFCADVLSTEPPSKDNPILSCPNTYITPHIAWASHEARIRLIHTAARNLAAFFANKPLNVVTFI